MNDLKDLSFLIYGLGLTGKSVVKFFNKNRFKNYKVLDDTNKYFYKKKRPLNLIKSFPLKSGHSFFTKNNSVYASCQSMKLLNR